MVNKNISSVPDELPDWLIPGSKVNLIKERKEAQANRKRRLASKEGNQSRLVHVSR